MTEGLTLSQGTTPWKAILTLDSLIQFWRYDKKEVGVNSGEGTPVPIPNTEVKLMSAEDTWREAARENRAMPTLNLFWLFLIKHKIKYLNTI